MANLNQEKAKSKCRYTDLHQTIEDINGESERVATGRRACERASLRLTDIRRVFARGGHRFGLVSSSHANAVFICNIYKYNQ
jgi:hypothetical protein